MWKWMLDTFPSSAVLRTGQGNVGNNLDWTLDQLQLPLTSPNSYF